MFKKTETDKIMEQQIWKLIKYEENFYFISIPLCTNISDTSYSNNQSILPLK